MIKPGDITNQMAATCWIHARGEGESMKWSISEILNAAIEAGIVSPPCHVKRHLGELECQGEAELRQERIDEIESEAESERTNLA